MAAGTHDREGVRTVTLGNGTTYTGTSVTGPAVPSDPPVVRPINVGLRGRDRDRGAAVLPGGPSTRPR